jgi:NAD(P)-dependent dehydrogenase (short-subunit alcohol dehydrogenase family)
VKSLPAKECAVVDVFAADALDGKVAFVAGGSSGINLAIAARFAAKGARVMLVSRNEERLVLAAKSIVDAGGSATWAVADVRDELAVQAALARCHEELGLIDVVLSGAAGNFLAPVAQLSSKGFRTVVDIDLVGTFNVLKHSHQHLRRPGASLMSISAHVAVKPTVGQIHAAAAKAGVNMITKVLATEWGPEGIRVNAISPGYTSGTEGFSRLVENDGHERELLRTIPLRRFGRKSEIADVALFLASDHARYITGSILECDGGLLLT